MFRKSLFILVFIAIGCRSTKQLNTDKAAIKQVLFQSAKDWNNGDMAAYMNAYWKSDKLQFIGRNGITYGWEQTLKNYLKSYPNKEVMGMLSFEILDLQYRSKNVYTLVGTYHLERKSSNADGIFSLLFERKDGIWCITSDHSE
ncbi:MAG: YybH family protein [Flavicella sp.]